MPLNATLPLIKDTVSDSNATNANGMSDKISLQIDNNTLQTEDVTIEDEATGA